MNHESIVNYFLEKRKPETVFQLGACPVLNPEIMSRVDWLTVFENRPNRIELVEKACPDVKYFKYDKIKDIEDDFKLWNFDFDFGVVAGELTHRGAVSDLLFQRKTKTIILMDYDKRHKCGYSSLVNEDYVFRGFSYLDHSIVGVFLRNDLNFVKIEGYS